MSHPSQGHSEVAIFILKHLQNKNPYTSDGRTALHLAAERGHLEIVKYIIMQVENKNPRIQEMNELHTFFYSYIGWTPLHFAAMEGHLKIVMCIAEFLEDKNPMAQDGQTPISLAKRRCKFLVVNYLNKAMRKQKSRGDGQNITVKRQKRT